MEVNQHDISFRYDPTSCMAYTGNKIFDWL